MMKKKLMKVFIAALTLLMVLNFSVFATNKAITVVSVDNISKTIYKGIHFDLPVKVKAKLENNTYIYKLVKWNPSKPDTNKLGKRLIYGTVAGYNKRVILSINIVNKPLSIVLIKNIKYITYVNKVYQLPKNVLATMSDKTKKNLYVSWKPNYVDTSKLGKEVYFGTVKGYEKDLELTLIVLPYSIELNENDVTQIIVYSRNAKFTLETEMKAKVISWVKEAKVIGLNNLGSDRPAPEGLISIYLSDGKQIDISYYGDIYTDLYKLYQQDLLDYFRKFVNK